MTEADSPLVTPVVQLPSLLMFPQCRPIETNHGLQDSQNSRNLLQVDKILPYLRKVSEERHEEACAGQGAVVSPKIRPSSNSCFLQCESQAMKPAPSVENKVSESWVKRL